MAKIHIFGASGSGVTTLGKALSKRYHFPQFDVDNFYWKKTHPPFIESNPIPLRHQLLGAALEGHPGWFLSGSMDSWAEPYVPLFDLAIYLYVPVEVRIERLKKRELEQFGDRILPGGDMAEEHQKFLKWAEQYDVGELSGRSKPRHDTWIKSLPCPVLRIEREIDLECAVTLVEQKLKENKLI